MSAGKCVVDVGEWIRLELVMDDGTKKWFKGLVQDVKKKKSVKYGSKLKYSIILDDGDTINTRLLHLNWKKHNENKDISSKKKNKRKYDLEPGVEKETIPYKINPGIVSKYKLPVHRLICAPMVGASELAFRLLCRRYTINHVPLQQKLQPLPSTQ